MKNFAKLALLGAAMLSLAACGGNKDPEVKPADKIANAKAYVYQLYKANQSKDSAEPCTYDLKRVTTVLIDGISFNITWSVDKTDKVKIENAGENLVVIKPDFFDTEGYEFTLTATITGSDGSKASQVFNYSVAAYFVPGWKNCILTEAPISTEEKEIPFYFGLYQASLDAMLYFTGAKSGNYLATSKNIGDAAACYIEKGDAGLSYYFYKDGAKKYFEVWDYNGQGKNGVDIHDTPANPGTWDAEIGQIRYAVGTGTFYMGTYNTYNTISSSNVSYIDGETNRPKVDVSQFPARSFSMDVAMAEGKIATELSEEATYKFGLYQVSRAEMLWATGAMSGNYLATSVSGAACLPVKAEKAATGGWNLYFVDGEAKKYFEVYDYNGQGKNGIHITDTPVNPGTWDAEVRQLRYAVGTGTFYMGTYGTYNTISSSNVSYIDGETNRAKIGVSQFVAYLFE